MNPTQLSRRAARRATWQRGLLASALVAVLVCIAAPFAGAAPDALRADRAAPSCSLASAKAVKAAFGTTIGAPTVTKNGPVTVCQYASSTLLLVRFETGETAARFAAGRNSFKTHGESTTSVKGVGTGAYSSTIGGATTLVVLKGTTELLLTATSSQPKIISLAKLILASL